ARFLEFRLTDVTVAVASRAVARDETESQALRPHRRPHRWPQREATQGGDGQAAYNLAFLVDAGNAGAGPIATKWNLSATPTLYVIDHKGVIRYKWAGAPGAKVIDAALDKVMKQAEVSGKHPPR